MNRDVLQRSMAAEPEEWLDRLVTERVIGVVRSERRVRRRAPKEVTAGSARSEREGPCGGALDWPSSIAMNIVGSDSA